MYTIAVWFKIKKAATADGMPAQVVGESAHDRTQTIVLRFELFRTVAIAQNICMLHDHNSEN